MREKKKKKKKKTGRGLRETRFALRSLGLRPSFRSERTVDVAAAAHSMSTGIRIYVSDDARTGSLVSSLVAEALPDRLGVVDYHVIPLPSADGDGNMPLDVRVEQAEAESTKIGRAHV